MAEAETHSITARRGPGPENDTTSQPTTSTATAHQPIDSDRAHPILPAAEPSRAPAPRSHPA